MVESRKARFSWDCVDERLIRKLLRAAYDAHHQAEDAGAVASLSPEQLRRSAGHVLGRPPKLGLRRKLTDTLRDGWLPKASAEELARLTGMVNRFDSLTTREQRIEFLRTRNRTDAFVANLWSAFIAAQKESVVAVGPQGGAPTHARVSAVELVGEGATGRHTAYAHQTEAWENLDRLRGAGGQRSGLIVIPTGGGKTCMPGTCHGRWLRSGGWRK
ncbi:MULTISPECIES: hypothetical protein [Mumia]|uniref:hypothetical protein n=1 Tax=Mumia TaxID=1546255 RepID=UPI001FBBD0FE|nr:hypothetical protein [Mumia sp. ZJ430]